MEETRRRVKSFQFAFAGISHAFLTQKNFQIQLFIGVLAVIFAWYLGFARWEWIILTILVGFVLFAELLNTVIEVVVDLAVKEKQLPEAKIAKDVSAATVLIASFVSLIIGILLFWPHLRNLIEGV